MVFNMFAIFNMYGYFCWLAQEPKCPRAQVPKTQEPKRPRPFLLNSAVVTSAQEPSFLAGIFTFIYIPARWHH
jgi:hypothetical protein